MSLTFHTPNFGDEEFEIPSLNIPSLSSHGYASGGATYQQLSHLGPVSQLPHPAQSFPPPYTCAVSNGYTQTPLGYRGPPVLPKFPPQSFDSIPDISHSQQQQQQQQQHQQQQQQQQQQQHQQQQHQLHNGVGSGQQTYIAQHHQSNHQQQQQHQHHQHPQQQHHPHHPAHPHQQPAISAISSTQVFLQPALSLANHQQHPAMADGMLSRSTVDKSQLNLTYGLRPKKVANSPAGRESEDSSDDSLPLAQLSTPGVTTAKRSAPSPNSRMGVGVKKAKASKKRKKKDPNEPQKPVSAYAMFFRDRQAAIKGANPNASFGEISKVVASMWDGLADDEKQMYKKRTEDAKKEYLKQLAAYRANLVSQGTLDSPEHDQSSSPPHGMMAPQRQVMGGQGHPEPILSSFGMGSQTTPLTHMGDPGNGSPLMHDHMATSPDHMMNMQAQQQMQGMSPMAHQMALSPQHMAMTTGSPPHMGMQSGSPPRIAMATGSPQHMGMATSPVHMASPPHMTVTGSYAVDNQVMGSPEHHMGSPGSALCVRDGCVNPAVDSPHWDNEYCSNDCVVSHCRDVFTAWVAARQGSGAYASVK